MSGIRSPERSACPAEAPKGRRRGLAQTPGASAVLLVLALFAPPSQAQDPAPPPLPYGDGLVATVNEDRVFGGDVLAEISDVIPGLRNAHPDEADFRREFHKLYDTTLFALIRWKVIQSEAKKHGLTAPDSELDAYEREEIRQVAGGDRERYKELLAQKGLTIARAREDMRRGLLTEKVVGMSLVHGPLYVSPEEIRRYYADHPDEFRRPERVKSRILSVVAASAGARDRARRMAESLRRQLDAGADFEAIRRWMSGGDGPGEAEWRVRGDLDPALEKAVFEAGKGAVVGPVEGADAYFLARVDDREEALTETFEQAQERIHAGLRRRRIGAERFAAGVRLMRAAYIENLPAEFREQFDLALAAIPEPR